MLQRTLTGRWFGPDGAGLASTAISYKLLSPLAVSDGGAPAPRESTFTTEPDGDTPANVTLAVPDTGSVQYLFSCNSWRMIVSVNGATSSGITVAQLFAASGISGDDADSVQALVESHNSGSTASVHGGRFDSVFLVHGTRPDGLPNCLQVIAGSNITLTTVGSPLITGLQISAASGGVTDHGALTGLGDDDHSQYLNSTRHNAITGNPHGTTAAEVTGAARTDAANTFTAGPQVMVGGATIRQSGGTAGTDEVQVRHTGSRAEIQSYDGGLRVIAPNGTNYLEIYDHAGNVMLIMNGSSDLQVRGGINNAMNPDAYTITGAGRWICRGPYDFRHPTGSGIDAGLARDAAGLVRVSDGNSGRGSLRALNFDASGTITPGVYTFATVPSASANAGGVIRISDRSGKHAYSDGTNWRFFADDTIIS